MYSVTGFFSKFSKTGFILNISIPYILTTHLLMNKTLYSDEELNTQMLNNMIEIQELSH